MKRMLFRTALGTVLGIWGSAGIGFGQISVGDTQEEVRQILGEPHGFAEVNGREAYTFERGHVIFRDGKVESHSLVSEEEARQRRERAENRRQERLAEGRELLARAKADAELANAPASRQLAFWETFRQKYPEIDVSFDHSLAARQLQAEEQREIRELERRVQEAEKMAAISRTEQADALPHHHRTGFPLVFGDPFFPDRSAGKKGKAKPPADRIRVRTPNPLPPTPREQAMPLQQSRPGSESGHRSRNSRR